MTVDLALTVAQNTIGAGLDRLSLIENLVGSAFNDTLLGDANANVLEGGSGNDTLDGRVGIDTASYAGSASAVTVSLAVTGAQNTVGAGIDTLISIENLIGTGLNDVLSGDGGANRLDGGAGSDQLTGGLGNDVLIGGSGIDEASYRGLAAAVTVDLSLTTAQNTGGGGTDTLSEIENVAGTIYNDVFTGTAGNNAFLGGSGQDTVRYANAAAGVTVDLALTVAQNTIGAGLDRLSLIENLVGSAFNDTLLGDANANVLEGGSGNDTLDGRAGTDTASYAGSASAVTVSLAVTGAQNTVGAGIDTLISIENLIGSGLNDVLSGDGGANRLEGGAGSDQLTGGLGNDVLIGGSGIDEASYRGMAAAVTVDLSLTTAQNTGGGGIDTLSEIENVAGTIYNDVFTGTAGANRFLGGLGLDTVRYSNAAAAVTVDLALTVAQNTTGAGIDQFSLIENLVGSVFNDTLLGDANANRLEGGAGNDQLTGGLGNDVLIGGSGIDEASYRGMAAAVTVDLSLTTAQNTGGGGTDTLSEIENVAGTIYNDVFTGTAGNNAFLGGSGQDTVRYANAAAGVTVDLALTVAQNTIGAGLDRLSLIENLVGSAFNDTLLGDANANVLDGGAGINTLTGRGGADTFQFSVLETSANRDTITDFAAGVDKIGIVRSAFAGFAGSAVGALSAADFTLGTAATTAAHNLIYDQATGNLWYDADGVGGIAQVQLALISAAPVLSAADFVLV